MKLKFNPPYRPNERLRYVGTGFIGLDEYDRECRFVRYAVNSLYVEYHGKEVLMYNHEVRRPVLEEWTYMRQCSWRPTNIEKYMNVEIVKEVSSVSMKWEDYIKELRTHANFKTQNTYCFVILANGKAIGLNENPAKGWGFPMVTYKGEVNE